MLAIFFMYQRIANHQPHNPWRRVSAIYPQKLSMVIARKFHKAGWANGSIDQLFDILT